MARGGERPRTTQTARAAVLFDAALYLGVVSATIEAVILCIRATVVFLEVVAGYPVFRSVNLGFGPGGLLTLAILTAACLPAVIVLRDGRTMLCLFWSAMMTGCWACLLAPAVRPVPHGGFERAGVTLLLSMGIAIVLAAATTFADWIDGRDHDRRLSSPLPSWGRLLSASVTTSVMIAGAMLILLIAFHLAMPVAGGGSDYRWMAIALAGSAFTGAWGCSVLVRREFHAGVAEVGMALASLGLCALATSAAPPVSRRLAEQYPVLFNAMVVGLAGAAGLWTEWTLWWQSRVQAGEVAGSATILVPLAKRTAFVSASLALMIAVVMAVWPRWPAIATMDHSLGRVTAGFSANLFLLLIVLRGARQFQRLTFHILTVLTVLVTAGFLVVRVLPFTPMYG